MFKVALEDIDITNIKNGSKTVQIQMNTGLFKTMNIGDTICFYNKNWVKCKILNINKYESFEELFNNINYKQCIPQALSKEDVINMYKCIYLNIPNGILAISISKNILQN
jgi:ASC-1-like (ASCH) protein